MAEKKKLYHYTSWENLREIEKSGYIEESRNDRGRGDDARYGTGVYLTELGPEKGKREIAENNYGSRWGTTMEKKGKVDCCLELDIPESKLKRPDSPRNVVLHEGRVNLSDYEYTVKRSGR